MKVYTVVSSERANDNDFDVEVSYNSESKTLLADTIFASKEDAEEYIKVYEEWLCGKDSGLVVVEIDFRFGYATDHYKSALAKGENVETWRNRNRRRR